MTRRLCLLSYFFSHYVLMFFIFFAIHDFTYTRISAMFTTMMAFSRSHRALKIYLTS